MVCFRWSISCFITLCGDLYLLVNFPMIKQNAQITIAGGEGGRVGRRGGGGRAAEHHAFPMPKPLEQMHWPELSLKKLQNTKQIGCFLFESNWQTAGLF